MSKYNWPDLIQVFEASGLSQTQFCKEQNLNPKYFNSKYSQYREKQSSNSAFVKAEVKVAAPTSTLTLQVGRCTVVCPESMPIQSFISLVNQLA